MALHAPIALAVTSQSGSSEMQHGPSTPSTMAGSPCHFDTINTDARLIKEAKSPQYQPRGVESMRRLCSWQGCHRNCIFLDCSRSKASQPEIQKQTRDVALK